MHVRGSAVCVVSCCTHTRAYTTLSISIDRQGQDLHMRVQRDSRLRASRGHSSIASHSILATCYSNATHAAGSATSSMQGPDPFLRFKQSKATERLVGHRKHTAKRMRSEYVCMMCLVWPTELTMEYVSTPPTPVRPGSARTQKLQPSHVVSTMPCIRAWRPRRTSTASEEEQPPAMCWHVETPSKHKINKSILY